MSKFYLIGFGAGLVSGVLFASLASGTPLAVTLIFFAPLPIYIVGLGWGAVAAALGAVGGLTIVIPMLGVKSALGYTFTLALPAILFCFLANLRREVPVQAGEAVASEPSTTTEWYPFGRIIAWATLIAGFMATVSVLLLGQDLESYKTSINEILNRTILQGLSDGAQKPFSKSVFGNYRDLFVWMLPAASAVVWMLGVVVNLYLSARIVHTSGRLSRPWPDISQLNYPRNFVFAFSASVLATFLPGFYGLLATGFVAAYFFAYVLLGLAIIHAISRNLAIRPLLIFAVYFGLIVFGWISLLIAIVGLGDPVFKLRERMSSPATPRSPDGG